MVVIVSGRKPCGKTTQAMDFLKDKKFIYASDSDLMMIKISNFTRDFDSEVPEWIFVDGISYETMDLAFEISKKDTIDVRIKSEMTTKKFKTPNFYLITNEDLRYIK